MMMDNSFLLFILLEILNVHADLVTNIALGKPATMSTVYNGMIANKSVDGSSDRDLDTCSCCSHSGNDPNPWLTVDLLQQYNIDIINVAGRSDDNRANRLLGGLEIYANDTDDLTKHYYTVRNGTDITVSLPGSVNSRFITLKRPDMSHTGVWFLAVCEIKIYTRDCRPGKYKDREKEICKDCGHCKNQPCNKDTGNCPSGVCTVGWVGSKCNTACGTGRYWQNCTEYCSGHCTNGNSKCNNLDGKCKQACVDGYTGDRCKTQCNGGTFGSGCGLSCHCINNTACNNVNGTCIIKECDPGWIGDACDKECNGGTFGSGCGLSCHCINNTACNNVNGTCIIKECDPGWIGDACDKDCQIGRFGRECAQSCHCADNIPCDKVKGHCRSAVCKTGWQGPACNEKCPLDTFGEDCRDKCYCAEGTCTNNYGICPGKCRSGYRGPNCNEVGSEMQTKPAIIGGAVGATVAFIAVAVIICIAVYRIRRKKRPRPNNTNIYATPRTNVTTTEVDEYDTLNNVDNSTGSDNNIYENVRVTGF